MPAQRMIGQWVQIPGLAARRYDCGFCGASVASERGWHFQGSVGRAVAFIYTCPLCQRPTFFEEPDQQYPGVPFGDSVGALPTERQLLNHTRHPSQDLSYSRVTSSTSDRRLINDNRKSSHL
jgi:hypothetical protein